MKKELHCPYSILDRDILCEHKSAGIEHPDDITLHNHDGYELLFFIHGEGTLFVESEAKKPDPGDLIIIPPYTFHGIHVTDISQYERVVLNFRDPVIDAVNDKFTDFRPYLNRRENSGIYFLSFSGDRYENILRILDDLEKTLKNRQFGYTALARAYLTQLFVIIANHADQYPESNYVNIMSPTVKNIFDYIDDNLCSELSVEILSQNLHHNADYLERTFKNTTGGTLKYYINAKKTALAQSMLREGRQPYDVCFLLGFRNYSSFSRCFSRHVGLSPKQYSMSLRRQ